MKLLEFPKELLVEIMKYADLDDLKRISLTCVLLKNVLNEESVWKDKLKSLSSIDNYSLPSKGLVQNYVRLLHETNEGVFRGCSYFHQDIKNLVLKSPELREKLSETTVTEIIEINKFFRK